jgi:hypothetical protein
MKVPNYVSCHQYYFLGMHKHMAVHLFANEAEALSMIILED